MKLIVFFLIIFLPLKVFSYGVVTEIHGPQEIIADIYDATQIQMNRRVFIFSRQLNRVVAFGIVKKIDLKVSPSIALIAIDEIIDNALVLNKDLIYPLDFNLMKEKNVPGFTSLTLSGDGTIPARFKELAYFGVFTAEGHPLDERELLISPFQLQYGIKNDFGIKMVNALWLDGYANLGLKYRLLRNKYARVTMNTLGAYKIQSRDYIWQVGGVVTLPANAKFQNHLMINITLDPQFAEAHATKGLRLFQDSDIRSITEYITNDWNRIIYGPTYNVELQTFGGTVSYMWIWDSFHTSLGFATRDFSNLEIGKKGYYYVYDLFWRF
jgi:hypothetical protein